MMLKSENSISLKSLDRFAAFYDLYDNGDRRNIKTSAQEGLFHYEC